MKKQIKHIKVTADNKETCHAFILYGVEMIYLTADPVTGRPFWEALGFQKPNQTTISTRGKYHA